MTMTTLLQYLANISQVGKSGPEDEPSNCDGASVEACVLKSNPLLEAFGNAKTIRNDNSRCVGSHQLSMPEGFNYNDFRQSIWQIHQDSLR